MIRTFIHNVHQYLHILVNFFKRNPSGIPDYLRVDPGELLLVPPLEGRAVVALDHELLGLGLVEGGHLLARLLLRRGERDRLAQRLPGEVDGLAVDSQLDDLGRDLVRGLADRRGGLG